MPDETSNSDRGPFGFGLARRFEDELRARADLPARVADLERRVAALEAVAARRRSRRKKRPGA